MHNKKLCSLVSRTHLTNLHSSDYTLQSKVKAKTHHLRLFASLCCLTIALASSWVRYNLDSRTRVPEVPQLPLPSKIMVQNPPAFRTTLAFLTKIEEAIK